MDIKAVFILLFGDHWYLNDLWENGLHVDFVISDDTYEYDTYCLIYVS